MLSNIILIILLLTIIYGYLIILVIKKTNFKNKIVLVLSIIFFFIAIQFEFFGNLGYPTMEDIPKKFKLISIYRDDSKKFYLLVKDIDNRLPPRLYSLNYSKNLDDTLSQASSDIEKGFNIIGEKTNDHSQNYYGIRFKRIKQSLPLK
ncbi:MAG: hypothetical protein VX864_01140 [Pseudomonadota bacterium]|nr:hypothetical protein [Pseudomonadota bacterium]